MWYLLILLLAGLAAPSPVWAGNIADGKAKAQACALCHGTKGVSSKSDVPSLAGQPDPFLEWQLVYFRAGTRQSPLMTPISEALSDTDVQNLGAYFASLPPPRPAAGKLDPELMAMGVKVTQKFRCGACHQRNFAGLEQASRLASQHEEYLLKSLREFKSGVRRGGGGESPMPGIAFEMTDEEMKAVAYYLAHHP